MRHCKLKYDGGNIVKGNGNGKKRGRVNRRFNIAVFMGLIILAIYGYTKQVSSQKEIEMQKSISEKILRFHVLANSDNKEDQQVKLMVRDAIGEYIEPLIADCDNLEETEMVVEEYLPQIVNVAEDVLDKEGYSYGATAKLTSCEFPVKTYGEYTFPKGEYRALEVSLGDGEGHNWWCVLYPNMCFRGSVYEVIEDDAKESLREVLDDEEYEAVFDSGEYEIRFKILDFFQ